MNNIVNELRALAADVGRGGDGWNFDIAGLAESAADAYEQVERERDAAVADINAMLRIDTSDQICRFCKMEDAYCAYGLCVEKAEWRGEQEGENECSD